MKSWLSLLLAVWATGASAATYVWLASPQTVAQPEAVDTVSDPVTVAIEDRGTRAYLTFTVAYGFDDAPSVPIEALLSDAAIAAAQAGALSPHDPAWRVSLERALTQAKERLDATELRLVSARLREYDG